MIAVHDEIPQVMACTACPGSAEIDRAAAAPVDPATAPAVMPAAYARPSNNPCTNNGRILMFVSCVLSASEG
jgi:hypothetical protein